LNTLHEFTQNDEKVRKLAIDEGCIAKLTVGAALAYKAERDALLRERDEQANEVERLRSCLNKVKENNSSLQSQLESVTKERDELISERKSATEARKNAESERDALQSKLTAVERERDNMMAAEDALNKTAHDLRNQLASAEARVKELERTLSERESSYRVLMEKHEILRAEHEKVKEELSKSEIAFKTLVEASEKISEDKAAIKAELDTLKSSLRWIPVSERMPTEKDARKDLDCVLRVEAFNENNGMRGYPTLNAFSDEGCKWTHFRTPTAEPEPAKSEAQRIAEEFRSQYMANSVNSVDLIDSTVLAIVEFALSWKGCAQ
jgi:chromosome segregation ATPase